MFSKGKNTINLFIKSNRFKNWRVVASLFLIVTFSNVSVAYLTWRSIKPSLESGPQQKMQSVILTFAQYPLTIINALSQTYGDIIGEPSALIIPSKFEYENFPCAKSEGFILYSGLDSYDKKSNVKLIRVNNGSVVKTWSINIKQILDYKTQFYNYFQADEIHTARIFNPKLLNDGSIVGNLAGKIFKADYNGKILWILPGNFHHSISIDSDSSIWAPSINFQSINGSKKLLNYLRDDSIAHISSDGRFIDNQSFSEILINNGLVGILLGQGGSEYKVTSDRIHLNSIVPATRDTLYWKKGDLLISARNLSTVFLYRPSTKKIIWHQTGPWLNQHDANFVSDTEISIYGNDVISGLVGADSFINKTNSFYLYNFKLKKQEILYKKIFDKLSIKSPAEGRANLLRDNTLFIEDTMQNRHIIIYKDSSYCMKYNHYDSTRSGILNWSSYIERENLPIIIKKQLVNFTDAFKGK